MQQLRKDFSSVEMLLQLVIERETLNEADFRVQQEIYDRRFYDTDPDGYKLLAEACSDRPYSNRSNSSSTTVDDDSNIVMEYRDLIPPAKSFKYTLKFPALVLQVGAICYE